MNLSFYSLCMAMNVSYKMLSIIVIYFSCISDLCFGTLWFFLFLLIVSISVMTAINLQFLTRGFTGLCSGGGAQHLCINSSPGASQDFTQGGGAQHLCINSSPGASQDFAQGVGLNTSVSITCNWYRWMFIYCNLN